MPQASFVSEHTTEYVLVPDLIRRLSPHFQSIIPMFFWSTREGNTTAARNMSGITVRLLTAFPRRPKISRLSDDRITMKVNQQLIDYARASADVGIAAFAGIPLVSSLFTFRIDSPCCWYDLREFFSTNTDCFVEMTLNGTVIPNPPSRSSIRQSSSDQQILNAVNRSPTLQWDVAIETLCRIRYMQPKFNSFPFFGGYKPFHLIFPIQ